MVAPALIPLAITIAEQFLPSIVKKITGEDDKKAVAEKVISVAKHVTGFSDPEQALKQAQVSDDFKDKLLEEFVEISRIETKDIQDARKNHKYHDTTVTAIKTALWLNPALIFLGIGILAYVVVFESLDSGSLSMLSAMIGGMINQLYQERQQCYSFLVGSSLGSKLKSMFSGR